MTKNTASVNLISYLNCKYTMNAYFTIHVQCVHKLWHNLSKGCLAYWPIHNQLQILVFDQSVTPLFFHKLSLDCENREP